jgi:RimJ/RimL family protein N-acetyltransferase
MHVKTQRLALQPIQAADVERLMELLTDEVVKQTYMLPDFASREASRPLAQRIQAMAEDPARYVAGIYLDEQLIGMLNETEREADSIEIGYALLPLFHNRGYCTEALMGLIPYLFGEGFRQVVTGAFEENAASIRVMVKSGMQRMDKEDIIAYRGRDHRCVYYCARCQAKEETV